MNLEERAKYTTWSKEAVKQKIKQNVNQAFVLGILILPGIFVIFPVIILITGSFMDQYELKEYLSPIFMENLSYVSWKLMPNYPSFGNYKKLLFQDPSFFILFWNSIRMTACFLRLLPLCPLQYLSPQACHPSLSSTTPGWC